MKKEDKTYKVIINFYKSGDCLSSQITQEEKEKILKTITNEFGYNENKTQDKHYPYFYNNKFYFGSPVVLNNVTLKEFKAVLTLFSQNGYSRYWITYKYRTYSLNEVKAENISINDISTQHNEEIWLTDNARIFVGLKNEVEPYRNGRAIIKEYACN